MSGASVLSMTGHGFGTSVLADGEVHVELRAVNHRHLDVRVRVPSELADTSAVVEDVVRARCMRGRIEASVRWEASTPNAVAFDLARARTVYQALLSLRDELTPGKHVPIEAVLQTPHVFGASGRFEATVAGDAVRAATERAASDLTAMRQREGTALARDVLARLAIVREHSEWVATRRPEIVESHRQRLHKRIEQLLEGSPASVDTGRLEHEVALFADKSDVAEELTRLASHLAQFAHLLERPGDSVGRKLDFLVQEIGREINTIGSKANDAGIAHRVVEMKAELERVREQIQNVL